MLAVRGDDSGYRKPLHSGRSTNDYALDLVRQIAAMNAGRYLEEDLLDAEPSTFCIGVGGYPEKHFEAPNLATDVRFAKEKIAAGADYIVTQMFFDNQHYFRFLELCREEGIAAPIIPGLKVLTRKSQLASIPRTFHVDIPPPLADEVAAAANPERVRDVGVEWALAQTRELLERGVPSVHFYVMLDGGAVSRVVGQLDL